MIMIYKLSKQICAVLFVIIFTSCYYDKADLLNPGNSTPVNCSTVSAKFAADVNPIIQSKCSYAGCHNASAAGGLVLLNYNQINTNSAKINLRTVVQKSMPSSGALPKADLDKIQCWINSGSPNN
jgi:uncharacterized membrane protein